MVYLQRWHGWCHMKLLPSRRVLCTPYNHAPKLQNSGLRHTSFSRCRKAVFGVCHAPCHFMQSHMRKVYACLAVTCHLHFWQNDRVFLLRATAVTRGWNGYRHKVRVTAGDSRALMLCLCYVFRAVITSLVC